MQETWIGFYMDPRKRLKHLDQAVLLTFQPQLLALHIFPGTPTIVVEGTF